MADANEAPSSREVVNNPAVNLALVLRDESAEVARLCANRDAQADLALGQDHGIPHRLGVAFSGGGIRSASVNLGIIQALARAGFLKQVHYMSGVSGGGYILGWLTSWIRRSGFKTVQEQLATGKAPDPLPPPEPGGQLPSAELVLHEHPHAIPPDPANEQPPEYARFVEPQPIRHLREYTSYLTPRMGLASGDTLAMISVYLRNVLLNQTLIISAAACLLALAQLLAPSISWRQRLPDPAQYILIVLGLLAGLAAGLWSGIALDRLGTNQLPKYEFRKSGILTSLCVFAMAACVWLILPTTFTNEFVGSSLVGSTEHPVRAGALLAGVFLAVMYLAGFLTDSLGKEKLRAVDDSQLKPWIVGLIAILTAGVFLAALFFGFEKWLRHGDDLYVGDWYVMLGLPAIMLAMALASYVHIGIFGNLYPDAKREWLGRLAGYHLFHAAIAGVVLIGALRGPLWMHLIFRSSAFSTGAGAWLKWILPGGWLFTVISGLVAGASPRTGSGAPDKSRTLAILAKVAPPVFLAGIFLLVSWGVYALATYQAPHYLTWVSEEADGTPLLKMVKPAQDSQSTLFYPGLLEDGRKNRRTIFDLRGSCWQPAETQPTPLRCPPPPPKPGELPKETNQRLADPLKAYELRQSLCQILWIAGLGLAIALILMGRLNVNEFSMHLFYRNRLVRAFLGASNVKTDPDSKGRRPSPFTGFALDDDVPLQELCSWWKRKRETFSKERPNPEPTPCGDCYDGPYPIWGTTLNLTKGEDLAWQKRKAASFIYSPLYCGWDYVSKSPCSSEPPGQDTSCVGADESEHRRDRCKYAYRGTGEFTPGGECGRTPYAGQSGGPLIGTAMAASGAAVSPNSGYHTSPAVAALLAIFNVRIGWWTGNPRRNDRWNKYAPAAYYLTAELLGWTGDAGRYVYLSDGGHFENLGIYELVRRRMKYIIACDADADPNYIFEDLANAVEKCRRDFGVEIEIDTSAIKPNQKTQLSKSHFAVGKINYPEGVNTPASTGVLLFFKSSLTGDEPADVLGRRAVDSKFPHDTTVNQFFNETQFEAYRALGQHMFDTVWAYHKKEAGGKFISPVQDPKNGITSFFHKLDQDREKKHEKKKEKQQQALRPEA
jgi:hypothetical protein